MFISWIILSGENTFKRLNYNQKLKWLSMTQRRVNVREYVPADKHLQDGQLVLQGDEHLRDGQLVLQGSCFKSENYKKRIFYKVFYLRITHVTVFYTQSTYNTNWNIQRHSSNSILQHFSSGVKVGKAISNLLIGIRKPLFSPALLCLVNRTFKYFSLLISFVFLLTPLQLNLSFPPKRQQVLLLRPMFPSPAHSSL